MNKILLITSTVLAVLILILVVLGSINRVGYLSEFKLNKDLSKKNEYHYNFRLKYYSKIFRNSDIYGVYFNVPSEVNINNDKIQLKNIKIEKTGSPFGTFIASKELKYDDKIDYINYKLKLKQYIIIILSILPLCIMILKFIFPLINYLIECCNNFLDKHLTINDLSIAEKIDNKYNNIYIIVFLIFFPVIFFIYESIYSSYPYYYAWDSSQLYAKDILLVSSNLFPEHLLHPNMIPLVLYKYIFIPIGKLFQIISISNIYELENSLNPHLGFIEFTEYILTICRVSFFSFITIMYINIVRIMQIQNIIKNKFIVFIFGLSVLIILSMSKFVYDAGRFIIAVIRYETIGLLLSSISLYFIISSSNVKKLDNNKHRIFLILSGVFVSAALLSKIMFAGWVIGIFIIYILLNLDKYFYYKDDTNIGKISNILILTTIFIILLNIFIFISFNTGKLLDSAFIGEINKRLLIYGQIIVPIFFIILSLIVFLVKKNIIKTNYTVKILLSNFVIYVLSCFYPILFALLLPMGIDTLFTTYIFSYSGGSILALINSGSHSKHTQKVLIFMVLILIILILALIYIIKNRKILFKNIFLVNIILNITLVIFSFICIKALRNGSDKLITTSLLVVSIFIFVRNIFNIFSNIKILKYILFTILFVISLKILITNIYLSRYDPVSSVYVYNINTWKTYSYGTKNGIRFSHLFKNSYPSDESWQYALFWSRNIKQTRLLLEQIRINNNSLNNTIIAYTNSKIDKSAKNFISRIDNNLCGGLILNLKDNNNRISLRADYDFFFISDIEYKKNDKRIELTNYDFYINDKKYFVYKLNTERKNAFSRLNINFNFMKNQDFNTGFILINDIF